MKATPRMDSIAFEIGRDVRERVLYCRRRSTRSIVI